MKAIPFVLLFGCAIQWHKPGATPEELRIHTAQCNERANSIPNAGIIQRDAVFENCMEGKGWLRK